MLAIVGLISRLLLPYAGQSDSLNGDSNCGHLLLLLPNGGQSDPVGKGAGCGCYLLPRQELHAFEMWDSYLSTWVGYDILVEDHLRYLFLQRISSSPDILNMLISSHSC